MEKTIFYFVRHAEPNYENHIDAERELTEKGLQDRERVTAFLEDKGVEIVLSSPFRRAVQTVEHFAQKQGLPILTIPDFRERKVDSIWIEDFNGFCRQQWADFSYKLSDGETLGEVQTRNIRALSAALRDYAGKTVVVGSHGTALSTIINYYDSAFGYAEFEKIRKLMPWVVKFVFEEEKLVSMEQVDLFQL